MEGAAAAVVSYYHRLAMLDALASLGPAMVIEYEPCEEIPPLKEPSSSRSA